MALIVKLHGTSGSGKSTVAQSLLQLGTVSILGVKAKIEGYQINTMVLRHPLFVLGPYKTQCGGCDALKADEQIELLHKYSPFGHIFYEGLLASEYYGRLGAASERYGNKHVFAFLDTPTEVCVERVRQRRNLKGNVKPFDPTNTVNRVSKIEKLRAKLINMGKNVKTIDYQHADQQVLALFQGEDNAQSQLT